MRPLLSVHVLVIASTACAQPAPPRFQPGGPFDDPPTSLAFALTVKPAGEQPGPTRQPLLTPPRDRIATNAAVDYLRAVAIREVWAKNIVKHEDEFDKALEKSPRELKGKQIEEYLEAHKHVFRSLDAATLADHCDWQMVRRFDAEGMGYVMEDIQRCRGLAAALKYRIRWSLGRGDIDAALRDVRTGMTMGRHIGEGPTLIMHLVGVSIESIFLAELVQVIQTPGAPNFYRALTLLPQPFFRTDAVIDGEQRMMEATFRVNGIRTLPPTQEQALAVLITFADQAEVSDLLPRKQSDKDKAQFATLLAASMVKDARKVMPSYGFADADMKKLTEAQIAVTDLVMRMRGRQEEIYTIFRLPYPEAREAMKVLDTRHPEGERNLPMIELMMRLLTPAAVKVRHSSLRVDRQIAMLRVIEGVRLHAAEHGGMLPESLAEVRKRVSLANDPATGKPFDYKLESKTRFMLGAAPFDGQKPSVANCVEYVVDLAP